MERAEEIAPLVMRLACDAGRSDFSCAGYENYAGLNRASIVRH